MGLGFGSGVPVCFGAVPYTYVYTYTVHMYIHTLFWGEVVCALRKV